MKKYYYLEFSIVFLIYLFFYNLSILYPIKVLLTMTHESFHALATLITGGTVKSIDLTGIEGVTISNGGFYPLIAISGYLGSSLLGSYIIAAKNKIFVLLVFIVYLFFMSILFTKISINLIIVLSILSILLFMVLKFDKIAHHLIFIIGSFFVIESIEDIKMYLFRIPKKTDSGLLAHYLGFDFLTIPISIFIFVLSLTFLYFGFKKFLKSDS